MSDHEETTISSGYSTPVPELDDHRPPPVQVQSSERPRRGTIDSQMGERHRHNSDGPRAAQNYANVRILDFEEAVVDDEAGDISPVARRQRRGTVDTAGDSRGSSPSPPNSVKAFAMARRLPALSFSADARPEMDLQRTMSITSRLSHRSKSRTARESEAASIRSNRSAAEDDVCFPQETRAGTSGYIDYEDLEDLIQLQKDREEERKRSMDVKEFPNLHQQATDMSRVQMATADGDILDVPTRTPTHDEKAEPPPPKATGGVAPELMNANRFQFFSTSLDQTIHAKELGGLIFPGEDIQSLFTPPEDDAEHVWWLNINCPLEEEVRGICKAFGVHPLTVEDIITQEAREKIELFRSYYFAIFRSYTAVLDEDGEREFEPFNMFVIVFRQGMVTFSHNLNPVASMVRERISSLKDYVDLSSDWICYAIIDNIIDNFGPAIIECQNAAEALDDDVYRARPDNEEHYPFLPKLGHIRKNIMGLMRLLGGKADVLKGFTKRCNENYQVTPRMEVGLYLGDIQDHVVTMMNTLGHLERMLSRAHSNYLAQLSIDSITQGTRANNVLSKITFLASIIVPLNVVTGLFGMNVAVPFSKSGSLVPFFVIVGILIAFSVTCVILARRMRYI
ncbi:magnesium transporter ALR2 [Coniella lustricola]|uniref:Magnesium transporter ALR2 n=1 Tax=Coniella lustricola TaxID=2025994 RepID=A0A2T3A5N9_9PEZI|nr:magnesium transporter ALR2 [Coniella lustricola]